MILHRRHCKEDELRPKRRCRGKRWLKGAQLESASKASKAGRQIPPRSCLKKSGKLLSAGQRLRQAVKCRPRDRLQLGAAQASLTSNTQLHMQDPCSKEAESVQAGCGKQQNLSAAAHRISALRGTRPFPCFGSGQLHIHTLPGSLETATNTSKSRTKFEGQSSTNHDDVTLAPLQGRRAQSATSLPWQRWLKKGPAGIH